MAFSATSLPLILKDHRLRSHQVESRLRRILHVGFFVCLRSRWPFFSAVCPAPSELPHVRRPSYNWIWANVHFSFVQLGWIHFYDIYLKILKFQRIIYRNINFFEIVTNKDLKWNIYLNQRPHFDSPSAIDQSSHAESVATIFFQTRPYPITTNRVFSTNFRRRPGRRLPEKRSP